MGEPITRCCMPTIVLVQRERREATCPECGEAYGPTEAVIERPALLPAAPTVEAPAPRRASRPGAQPDARVQVADEARLRPSSVAPVERVTHVEDPELVRARRLLTELRPDRGGPLGWAADGVSPKSADRTESGAPIPGPLAARIRVQTSVVTPAILPGAFASTFAPAALGSGACDRIRDLTDFDPAMRAVLTWLQREGTLADGLRALYREVGLRFANADTRVRWKVLPSRLVLEATTTSGRTLTLRAADVWEGEIEWVRCGACDGWDLTCKPCGGQGYVEKRRDAAPSGPPARDRYRIRS